jgi:uncharacterized membrane protein YccC
MTRLMGLYVALVLGSEAITLEVLRLIGTCIGATAATVAAVLSYRARRELRSRRFRVRDPENEHAVVIDTPPSVERKSE